jgi:hypothetical protein
MLRSYRIQTFLLVSALTALLAGAVGSQNTHSLVSTVTELSIKEGLAVGLLGSYGSSAIPSALLAWQLASGTFRGNPGPLPGF